MRITENILIAKLGTLQSYYNDIKFIIKYENGKVYLAQKVGLSGIRMLSQYCTKSELANVIDTLINVKLYSNEKR